MEQPTASPTRPQVPYAGGRATNAMAIWSLATGIASWIVCPIVGSIVAVVTGHIARSQIRRTGEEGAGMALAGLILGYVHLAVAAIVLVILVIVLIVAGIALFQASQG